MADKEHHQPLSSTAPTAEWGTPNMVRADMITAGGAMIRAGRASDSGRSSQEPGGWGVREIERCEGDRDAIVGCGEIEMP